jgi:hypothetical protein
LWGNVLLPEISFVPNVLGAYWSANGDALLVTLRAAAL